MQLFLRTLPSGDAGGESDPHGVLTRPDRRRTPHQGDLMKNIGGSGFLPLGHPGVNLRVLKNEAATSDHGGE